MAEKSQTGKVKLELGKLVIYNYSTQIKHHIKKHSVMTNLQHEVFPQNVPHTMQSRCNGISIPWLHKKNKNKKPLA